LIFVSPIHDHRIANAQADRFAQVECLFFGLLDHLLREGSDIEIEKEAFNHHYRDDHTKKDLSFQTP
jgi:hypothetical protein